MDQTKKEINEATNQVSDFKKRENLMLEEIEKNLPFGSWRQGIFSGSF